MTTSREPYRPTLTTDADVTTMWRTMINPLGWRTHRLYFVLVDGGGRPSPQLIEVDEIPHDFDADHATRFAEFLATILGDLMDGDYASVAVLFARPGAGGLTDADRARCRDMYVAAKAAGVGLELLHVATGTAITPAPMDEVLPRTA